MVFDTGPLLVTLERSRQLGFLGPGPVRDHVDHAEAFLLAIGCAPPERLIDLGSGGGVPGLILAVAWPLVPVVLVDSSERRTSFLAEALRDLGLIHARVIRERAETLGRDHAWRGWADVVVARSFGSPASTAECGAPLLGVGGRLIVSEPPDGLGRERWPDDGLALLGLGRAERVEGAARRVQVLRQQHPCSDRFARRPGVPTKRPLF
ncbi:MAG: 16S rRNA (guanine(527)-N(7))-methyltransferase RsmG [Acidimicrobiales bacterium]